MTCRDDGKQIHYRSERTHRGTVFARFVGNYQPTGEPYLAQPATLEHWLTNLYSLYTVDQGRVYIGEIHHIPWPLQPAAAEESKSTKWLPPAISSNNAPLLHFVRRIDVAVWQLQRMKRA